MCANSPRMHVASRVFKADSLLVEISPSFFFHLNEHISNHQVYWASVHRRSKLEMKGDNNLLHLEKEKKINLRWSLIKFCKFILRLKNFLTFFRIFFLGNSQRNKKETFQQKWRDETWNLNVGSSERRCNFSLQTWFQISFPLQQIYFSNVLRKWKTNYVFCWFRVEVESSRVESSFPGKSMTKTRTKKWRQHHRRNESFYSSSCSSIVFFSDCLTISRKKSELSMKEDSSASTSPREPVKNRFLELFTLYISVLKDAGVKDETLDNFLP